MKGELEQVLKPDLQVVKLMEAAGDLSRNSTVDHKIAEDLIKQGRLKEILQ